MGNMNYVCMTLYNERHKRAAIGIQKNKLKIKKQSSQYSYTHMHFQFCLYFFALKPYTCTVNVHNFCSMQLYIVKCRCMLGHIKSLYYTE